MGSLRRHLGLWKLTFYGVGDILGAGIYALVGQVAFHAGNLAWSAFVLAFLVSLPTALSYAKLSSRYPKSGGAAVFVGRAFQKKYISFVVGFLVLLSGLVSVATVANAFHGYLSQLVTFPRALTIIGFVLAISLVNFWGIEESSRLNILCVIAEVGGLLLIIGFGWKYWGQVDLFQVPVAEVFSKEALQGIGAASVLAFYATIGFEDICNISEEVKQPERNVPRAILLALSISSLIYIGIAITVVSVASSAELGDSKAPLALVASRVIPFLGPKFLSSLALFSVTNTALANLIMVSRLFYGMANEGWILSWLGRVHGKRQTPVTAIVCSAGLAIILALTGTISLLGQTTSLILLSVFSFVNLAALKLRISFWIPSFGVLLCLGLISHVPPAAFGRLGILVVIGACFYLLFHKTPLRRQLKMLN